MCDHLLNNCETFENFVVKCEAAAKMRRTMSGQIIVDKLWNLCGNKTNTEIEETDIISEDPKNLGNLAKLLSMRTEIKRKCGN